MENLEKVGGSCQRVARVKALLWSGKLPEALKEFDDWDHPRVDNFRAYVTGASSPHCQLWLLSSRGDFDWFRRRRINDTQKAARLKLSGAQWKA